MTTIRLAASPVSARLTRAETGRVLGIGRNPLARLLDGGWSTTEIGDVAALAARPTVHSDVPLTLVRLGAPAWDGPRRIGIAPQFTDEEVTEAARQWWISDPDAIVDAGHLLVAVGGFAVALLAVEGVDDSASSVVDNGTTVKRWSYAAHLVARVDNLVDAKVRVINTGTPVDELLPALGNRVPTPRGGPVVLLPRTEGGR